MAYSLQLHFSIATIIILAACSAHAEVLTFSFTDPTDDLTLESPYLGPTTPTPLSSTKTDLVSFSASFENLTGNYQITIKSSLSNPFIESGRFNFIFTNPDAGANASIPFKFAGTFFYNLSEPTTELTFSSNHPSLLAWKAGDRISASSLPFGLALDESNSAYYTGLEGKYFSFDYLGATDTTSIQTVAEPSILHLYVLGAIFLTVGSTRTKMLRIFAG